MFRHRRLHGVGVAPGRAVIARRVALLAACAARVLPAACETRTRPARDGAPSRVLPAGVNEQGFEVHVRESDGARMVRVAGGQFVMGVDGSPHHHAAEQAQLALN